MKPKKPWKFYRKAWQDFATDEAESFYVALAADAENLRSWSIVAHVKGSLLIIQNTTIPGDLLFMWKP